MVIQGGGRMVIHQRILMHVLHFDECSSLQINLKNNETRIRREV